MSKAQQFVAYIFGMIGLSLGIVKLWPFLGTIMFTYGEGLDIHIALGWCILLGTALLMAIMASVVAVVLFAQSAWTILGEINSKKKQ